MKLTYHYRLYPTNEQAMRFTQWLTTCRILYNTSLAERRESWTTAYRSVTYTEQATQLKAAKTTNPFLRAVYSQVLQDVLRRLDKTFKNFFRRVKNGEKAGYPRFKGRTRYDSFTYPQSGFALDSITKKLVLLKIGAVNIKYHRPIPAEGVITTCTIKRDVDHWYACFTVDLPDKSPLPPNEIHTAIGVDVGVTHLLALNNGEMVENPRWFRSSEQKLAKAQRRLSRKKKGSHNRDRQRVKVAWVHRKIRNQRKDFHHKISRQLVASYDLIVYEDLRITTMVKNYHLAKSISDAGWDQLVRFTQYKAAEAGSWVEYVNAYGTTHVCNRCGKLVPKTLAMRIHRCPYCGLVLHRDTNSATEILARSKLHSVSLSGQELSGEPAQNKICPVGEWMKQEATHFNGW